MGVEPQDEVPLPKSCSVTLGAKSPIACSAKQSQALKILASGTFDVNVYIPSSGWGKSNEYYDKNPQNFIVEGDDIISVDPKTRVV